jgi:hypothetical protein
MFASESGVTMDWGITTDYGLLAAITSDHKTNLSKNIGSAILYAIHNWDKSCTRILNFNQKIRSHWTWEGIGQQYLDLFCSILE